MNKDIHHIKIKVKKMKSHIVFCLLTKYCSDLPDKSKHCPNQVGKLKKKHTLLFIVFGGRKSKVKVTQYLHTVFVYLYLCMFVFVYLSL